jgi:hypothetical protein
MAEENSIWKEVSARLGLIEAAQRLGIAIKLGLQASPFRQDKKLSFSVFRSKDGTLGFKDHADDTVKGGLFQFVKLATGWENKAVADWLFEQSGVDRTKSEFSKGKAAEMRRLVRESAYQAHEQDLRKVPVVARPEPWSKSVSEHWSAGAGWIEKNAERISESRGWPVSVVHELSALDLISGPALPWGDTHGVAFRVDMPVKAGKTGELRLEPVGYHQRFITFKGSERSKSWVFVPYTPPTDRTNLSDFQKTLTDEKRTVPPLPFVLGSLDCPKLVVILEGQWDAITFFHACGWFADTAAPSAAVFGLRGVNGIDAFLAFYADWLRVVKPAVWLIGDNDKAGRKWAERQDVDKIHSKPSFIDRIKALGASRVVYRVIAEKFGKDFNDFYKAAAPDAEFMRRWMEKLGLFV